jgi:hypothetical protein
MLKNKVLRKIFRPTSKEISGELRVFHNEECHSYIKLQIKEISVNWTCILNITTNNNSVALVREQTILTEQLPLVDKVSAYLCR